MGPTVRKRELFLTVASAVARETCDSKDSPKKEPRESGALLRRRQSWAMGLLICMSGRESAATITKGKIHPKNVVTDGGIVGLRRVANARGL